MRPAEKHSVGAKGVQIELDEVFFIRVDSHKGICHLLFFSLEGEFLCMSHKPPFLLELGVSLLQTSPKHVSEVEWELIRWGLLEEVYIVRKAESPAKTLHL